MPTQDSRADVKIVTAFMCDDVRVEVNGKLIFVGAYQRSISVRSFPANLSLRPVLIVASTLIGKADVAVRMKGPTGSVFAEVAFEMGVAAPEEGGFVPLPQIPVTMSQPGSFRLEVQVNDQGFAEIGMWSVVEDANLPVP